MFRCFNAGISCLENEPDDEVTDCHWLMSRSSSALITTIGCKRVVMISVFILPTIWSCNEYYWLQLSVIYGIVQGGPKTDHFPRISRKLHYVTKEESRAVTRKPPITFPTSFKSSQASKARLQSSKHTVTKQNLTQNGHSHSQQRRYAEADRDPQNIWDPQKNWGSFIDATSEPQGQH